MASQTQRQAASPRRRRSLYRAVLSIAVAALIAAWLPFSILYTTALVNHAAAVAKATSTQTAGQGGAPTVQAPAPVTTRAS